MRAMLLRGQKELSKLFGLNFLNNRVRIMTEHILHCEIILYVQSQEQSTQFYENLFRSRPILNVPGMTEFELSESCKLGLMPNDGIAKILSDKMPSPADGVGIPRCELYLLVNDIQLEYENALNCGAKLISQISDRDWGDRVCYFSDPDGHVIAFAKRLK